MSIKENTEHIEKLKIGSKYKTEKNKEEKGKYLSIKENIEHIEKLKIRRTERKQRRTDRKQRRT